MLILRSDSLVNWNLILDNRFDIRVIHDKWIINYREGELIQLIKHTDYLQNPDGKTWFKNPQIYFNSYLQTKPSNDSH